MLSGFAMFEVCQTSHIGRTFLTTCVCVITIAVAKTKHEGDIWTCCKGSHLMWQIYFIDTIILSIFMDATLSDRKIAHQQTTLCNFILYWMIYSISQHRILCLRCFGITFSKHTITLNMSVIIIRTTKWIKVATKQGLPAIALHGLVSIQRTREKRCIRNTMQKSWEFDMKLKIE